MTDGRSCMRSSKTIEISLAGAILVSAAIAFLAVATSRLVDSFVTDGESGSGDWSLDEKLFSLLN